MKTHILPIILAGLILAFLSCESVAAPVLPAGHPKEIASFKAHRYEVEGLAFSPEGKVLVSCGSDGKVRLWDVASGKNLLDIKASAPGGRNGGLGRVDSVVFSPDGKILATSDDDRMIKLWDAATGKNTDSFRVGFAPPLLFSPDGKTIVCGYRRLNLATRKDQPLVEKITGRPLAASFDPKGKLLVATASGWPIPPCIWLWDTATGKKAVTCKEHEKYLMCLTFSPDGKKLASASYDQTVRLWNVVTGENTATFGKLPKWNSCALTFSPDGKILAMGYGRNRDSIIGSILLLDVPSGKILATLKGDSDAITCQAFSPDGRLLASGGLDGIIKIWSLPKRYKAE